MVTPTEDWAVPYDVTSDLDPPDLILWLTGELDFATDDGLSAYADPQLADVQSIVVDLSGLEFIDVAGVRVLRAWHDTMTAVSRSVQMVSAQRSVRRVFELLESEAYLAAA